MNWRTAKIDADRVRQHTKHSFNYLKKGGGDLICQHSKKGWGEKEWERGLTGRVCFCVGERDGEEEECRMTEGERTLAPLRSRLWRGLPVEAHSSSSQRQKGSGQCGGEVATSFKSLRDHIGLPLTSSRLTHCSHRHSLSCLTHQPLNQLCCPVRSKGFPRLRHRDGKNKKTDWGKEI